MKMTVVLSAKTLETQSQEVTADSPNLSAEPMTDTAQDDKKADKKHDHSKQESIQKVSTNEVHENPTEIIIPALITDSKTSKDASKNGITIPVIIVPTNAITAIIPRRTGKNVWKNLTAISVGFFFLFLAFCALADIQSSLNPDNGLGTISLSVIYASVVLSCMFVPSFIIKKLGCKGTLVVASFMYSSYAAANFYPSWETLLSSSAIVGIASAPLWSAKCTYLTQMGTEYATNTGQKPGDIIVRLFGFFFMMVQSGRIAGNLISSLVLKQGSANVIGKEQLAACGAWYCNEPLPFYSNNTNDTITTNNTGKDKLYLLCGIYLVCALLSVVVLALCVDPLLRHIGSNNSNNKNSRLKLLVATFQQMKNPKQLLMIPITVFGGLQQGFISGDFTKAFITCPLGIDKVGFVMVCFCSVDAFFSIAFTPVVKRFGRMPVYFLGTITNVSIIVVFFTWIPDPDKYYVFFIISALWGMTDAIWLTQNNAFYGLLFTDNEEAAFANYLLWESTGFIMAFAYSNYLCMNVKLYTLLICLCIGMIGYLRVEFLLWKESKTSKN